MLPTEPIVLIDSKLLLEVESSLDVHILHNVVHLPHHIHLVEIQVLPHFDFVSVLALLITFPNFSLMYV